MAPPNDRQITCNHASSHLPHGFSLPLSHNGPGNKEVMILQYKAALALTFVLSTGCQTPTPLHTRRQWTFGTMISQVLHPIGPGIPVGPGLVHGPGGNLLHSLRWEPQLDQPDYRRPLHIGATGWEIVVAEHLLRLKLRKHHRQGRSNCMPPTSPKLYSVDPPTGAATLIGATGISRSSFTLISRPRDPDGLSTS